MTTLACAPAWINLHGTAGQMPCIVLRLQDPAGQNSRDDPLACLKLQQVPLHAKLPQQLHTPRFAGHSKSA
jgi:hypothetical protein